MSRLVPFEQGMARAWRGCQKESFAHESAPLAWDEGLGLRIGFGAGRGCLPRFSGGVFVLTTGGHEEDRGRQRLKKSPHG
jgi:hypothetical protein